MLYKYLNPNLIAVVTEVTPDSKPGISIYLIDAVTGIKKIFAKSPFSPKKLLSYKKNTWRKTDSTK